MNKKAQWTESDETTTTCGKQQQGDFQQQMARLNSTVQAGQGTTRASRGVCKRCGRVIVAGRELVTSTGEVYHPEHFQCGTCGRTLATSQHYALDGAYYCPACWAARCPVCAQCGEPIVAGAKIEALGRVWHEGHFRCAVCDRALGTAFAVADGRPCCPEHARGLAAPIACARCTRPITGGLCYHSQDGRQHWHADCFTCAVCRQPFPGGVHYELDGDIFCETHCHARRGSLCAACGRPVIGDAVQACDSVWFVFVAVVAVVLVPLFFSSHAALL